MGNVQNEGKTARIERHFPSAVNRATTIEPGFRGRRGTPENAPLTEEFQYPCGGREFACQLVKVPVRPQCQSPKVSL